MEAIRSWVTYDLSFRRNGRKIYLRSVLTAFLMFSPAGDIERIIEPSLNEQSRHAEVVSDTFPLSKTSDIYTYLTY